MFVLLSFLITCFSLMLGTQARHHHDFFGIIIRPPPAGILKGLLCSFLTLMKPLAVPPPGWVVINLLKMPPTKDSITQFSVCSRSVDRTEHPDPQTRSKNNLGKRCRSENATCQIGLDFWISEPFLAYV